MGEEKIDIKNHLNDDEIDLREMFVAIWRGKMVIIVCIIISILFAALYLRSTEQKFTVQYVFAPVSMEDNIPKIGNLGGLASLAGISIPSSSSSDFLKFKFLIKSEEVAQVILEDDELVRLIFNNEWDNAKQIYRKPQPGPYELLKNGVKKFLTGQDPKEYLAPNAARLSHWMKDAFFISEDRDTGFLTLTSETSNPDLILKIMTQASTKTDTLLKNRYTKTAEQTMSFYQKQIRNARAREHREALAKLIAKEDQKLMLASKSSYFVAKPLTNPSISLQPTSPKPKLVLALSVVLGGFFGVGAVLARKAFG